MFFAALAADSNKEVVVPKVFVFFFEARPRGFMAWAVFPKKKGREPSDPRQPFS